MLAQAVMETEVSSQIGVGPYERSSEGVAYRNGYRTRRWDTRTGTIELKIPKLTAGTYFPSLLEPRRRAEKALHAVIVESYPYVWLDATFHKVREAGRVISVAAVVAIGVDARGQRRILGALGHGDRASATRTRTGPSF